MLSNSQLPLKFWIIASVGFINAVSFTIIIPILYPYAQAFNLSDFQASLLTTSYAASQFMGTPVLGRFSDQLGRKPVLILSLLGTVASNSLAALTPFAWLLYVARIFDGLTGGNTSIARAIISDMTDSDQRPVAFGIFDATFRLGFVVGPALSFLAQTLPPIPGISSLGMSFLVSAGIALLATGLTIIAVPETHTNSSPEMDSSSTSKPELGISKTIKAIGDPLYGRLYGLTFLSGFTFTIFTFAFQPFFLNVLNQDAKTLAIYFALIGILGFLSQVFGFKQLKKHFSLVMILATSIMLRGILFLLLPTFPNLWAFTLIMGVFGVVNSFPLPLINALISLKSRKHQQGEVLGINASYLSIANAFGPAVAGLLVELGYKAPLWITGVLTLMTAGYAFSLSEPTPSNPDGSRY